MGDRELGIFWRVGLIAAIASALVAASVALAASTTLTIEKAKPGTVVVTSNQRALYLFAKDSSGRSNCSGSCAQAWPALPAVGSLSVAKGSGLNQKLLGKMRRSDGKLQVTYNRHPLYTFSGDKKAGDIKGEGVNAFGAHWYLVSPGGSAVKPRRGNCPKGYVPSPTGCVPGQY